MIVVKCPFCGTKKVLTGTIEDHVNIRIRCSKKAGGCGDRYYSKSNIIKDVGQSRTKVITQRFKRKEPTRGSFRGIKTFLGLPEDHTLGATIQTECQDIIDYLITIKPTLKVR